MKYRKIVSWNIGDRCNYNCSYCSQGKYHNGSPGNEVVNEIIKGLANIGGGWEIKISGGEPFCYPDFNGCVNRLADSGFLISVVTNFSFPKRVYKKFLDAAGENLRTVSLSLHLEKVSRQKFLKKCLWFKALLERGGAGSLVVNSVVVPGRLAELAGIMKTFQNEGIKFYPQLLKKKGKVIEYSPGDEELIERLAPGRDPRAINRGYNMKGRKCFAGTGYFIITPRGDCYTCYPGKRDGSGYLGSILDPQFSLKADHIICPYDACPCTVPLNRGIAQV